VRTAAGVTERIAPTPVGYQRSWTFTAGPAQGGAIVASVAATADAVLSMDSSGLHVVRGGTGFRIGSATWIDAGGVRTTIAPSYEHGQLVYEVPADLVARSAFPAVLDPDVGPEFLVPPTQNINPWLYTNDPTVGSTSIFPLDNGGVGVIVSGSTNGGPSAGPYWGSGQLVDLYAPSASAASGLTLQTSRAFSGAPTGQSSGTGCVGSGCPVVAVASSPCGSDECIAWAYMTSAGTVYMQRFDTTTWQWYDTSPVTISDAFNDSPKTGTEPQLVANGTQYLVCWFDTTANNVHCSTRAAGSLAAVGSTVAVSGPTTITNYSTAATSGAFGVLVPGTVSTDGGVNANASVTVITSSTGAATGSAVTIPGVLGVGPTLAGESGGNFLVGGRGTVGPVPGLLAGGKGNPPSTIVDASLPGFTSGLVQRVSSAGALSGSPFSPGGGFSVDILSSYCNSGFGGGGNSLADAGLLPVPGRGTVGWSGPQGSAILAGGPGGTGPLCTLFSFGTVNMGSTFTVLPPFVQAVSGPLADGGFVRADPDGGLCQQLDAGGISSALPYICYDTAGGGLGAFVAPAYNDAGSASMAGKPGGTFSAFTSYEIAAGATTGTLHPEISGTVPSALDGIQNGFVSVGSTGTSQYGGSNPTTSLASTLYNADAGLYQPAGSPIPFIAMADRRTALHGTFDSVSQSFFVGWFGEGTTPLAEAGTNSLPNAAIYVSVYADPGGAADAGTTAKAAPLAITPPSGFSFAEAPNSSCFGCPPSSNGNGSLNTEPIWSMDGALNTALVSYVGLKSNNTTVLVGQLVNKDGTAKGSAGALSNVTGVTALHTCHSVSSYFVSYLASTGATTGPSTAWSTVSVDPSQATITPVAEPAGSPVPFANAVGNVMPAYLTVTSGSNTTTHVGIVSVSNPTTIVKDFDSDISSWSPAQAGFASGGTGGGYFGNLDVYSGTDNIIVTYPVQSGSATVTYCARIDTSTGNYIDSHPCTPPKEQ
jgi:hypothetical protein